MDVVIGSVISIMTGISGFYYGLRKQSKDLTKSSLDNILVQITIYEKIIEDLRSEITILIHKIDEQEKVIKHLEDRLDQMIKKKA